MKLRNLFLITMFSLLCAPLALGDELAVGKTGSNTSYTVTPAPEVEAEETESSEFDTLVESFLEFFE